MTRFDPSQLRSVFGCFENKLKTQLKTMNGSFSEKKKRRKALLMLAHIRLTGNPKFRKTKYYREPIRHIRICCKKDLLKLELLDPYKIAGWNAFFKKKDLKGRPSCCSFTDVLTLEIVFFLLTFKISHFTSNLLGLGLYLKAVSTLKLGFSFYSIIGSGSNFSL